MTSADPTRRQQDPDVLLALPLVGRGDVCHASLHGEPIYVHALRTLAGLASERGLGVPVLVVDEAQWPLVRADLGTSYDVDLVDQAAWPARRDGRAVLVHDPLCPLTPREFLAEMLDRGRADGRPLAAFRPVTDTLKTVEAGRIRGTVDRETLAALVSPVFVPAGPDAPPMNDFSGLVTWLRSLGTVELVKAPPMAQRVYDGSAVNLLECLDALGRRLRIDSPAART